jgi:hypothetical protein
MVTVDPNIAMRAGEMLTPTLTALILVGYAASLWWLLRREPRIVLVGLLAICAFSLCLRLVYTTDFPPGFDDDEPKLLANALVARRGGLLFRPSEIMTPVLLKALFEAAVYQIVPGRWAMRGYSMAASVLAALVAYAAARGLKLRTVPALAAAVFASVLPWSIFWGRIMVGGQLVFHELLLLAALGRIVWAGGGAPEVAIGGFGLGLLCYDYFCGQVMLGMPLAAAMIARTWRGRALSIATLSLALMLWAPYLYENGWFAVASINQSGRLFGDTMPLSTLITKAGVAFHSFLAPVAADFSMTIRSGAMHPPLMIGLALIGTVVGGGLRRSLFLWGGFLAGIVPALLHNDFVSAKRMLMAYPFVTLAAACALDRAGDGRWARIGTALVVLVIAVQGVWLYFSPASWPAGTFEVARSGLVESLPPPWSPRPRLIADRTLVDELVISRYNSEPLTIENWIPPSGEPLIYAFNAPLLVPFYTQLFGASRVRNFYGAFRVDLEPRDWSWLRQHGWVHEIRCGTKVWQAQVPTLYRGSGWVFQDMQCLGPRTLVWRGRWLGPPSTLRLFCTGPGTVDTSGRRVVDKSGLEHFAEFHVEPGMPIAVTVVEASEDPVWLLEVTPLKEVTPFGGRIPAWENVGPLVGGSD